MIGIRSHSMEELPTITANGKQLRVIYSKQEQGLYLSFSSDEKIREYILRNTEEAFCESVTVDDEGTCHTVPGTVLCVY